MVKQFHFIKTPEKSPFSRIPEKSPFERVGLFIVGVFFLLFVIEYVETETMAESLSVFHWIWH